MKGIFLSADEIETLHGLGPLPAHAYLHLRAWMDLRTGVVGRTRPISLAMIAAYCETHVTRGRGFEVVQPTEKAVRCALDRLQRAGLVRRLAGDRLAFSLPLAVTVGARPANAGRGEGVDFSTMRGAGKAFNGAGFSEERGTSAEGASRKCAAHIGASERTSSTPRTAATHEPGLRAREPVAAGGRPEAIAGLLRGAGVRVRVDDPVLGDLAQRGVSDADLLAAVDLARQARAAEGSSQPVGVRFVVSLLDRVRSRAPMRGSDAWWVSVPAMESKARELGIPGARPGEELIHFRERIRAAVSAVA